MSSPASNPSPLDAISIAAPCTANWNEMAGDERSRACSLCKKHVYNLSAMSRTEAEALIREKEGKICVRLFKRADGTVIVDNCPVALRAIRKRLQWVGIGVAAALTFVGSAALAAIYGSNRSNPANLPSGNGVASQQTGEPLKHWLFPVKPAPVTPMMGDMAYPVPCATKD